MSKLVMFNKSKKARSPLSDFYSISGEPVVGGIVSTPAMFDIAVENAFHDTLQHRPGIAILTRYLATEKP
jgi:hypothetical protein